jgi:hypothetical protein
MSSTLASAHFLNDQNAHRSGNKDGYTGVTTMDPRMGHGGSLTWQRSGRGTHAGTTGHDGGSTAERQAHGGQSGAYATAA